MGRRGVHRVGGWGGEGGGMGRRGVHRVGDGEERGA